MFLSRLNLDILLIISYENDEYTKLGYHENSIIYTTINTKINWFYIYKKKKKKKKRRKYIIHFLIYIPKLLLLVVVVLVL